MVDRPIKVLLIEDDPLQARLIKEMRSDVPGTPFDLECVDSLFTAIERLSRGGIDLVLLDLSLPDSAPEDTFASLQAEVPGVPIIVLTGMNDETLAVSSVKEGAEDYLVKGEVDGRMLVRCMRYAIERKKTKEKLSEMLVRIEKSHDDMLAILDQMTLITIITDEEGKIAFLSKTGQDCLQINMKEAIGRCWEDVFPFKKGGKEALRKMSEHPSPLRSRIPVQMVVPGGSQYWFQAAVCNDPRNSAKKIFYLYDITETYNLRRQLEKSSQCHELVGRSKEMQKVYKLIGEVAKVDWSVMIEGETGAGKELVARAVHFSSHRREKPFIAVNCGGLNETLLTSQLFGHVRGAFTGAVENHQGLFEAADGGTLFLDEIGDVSREVQSNLLRAIETKEITRLGESTTRKVDVRLITATNKDLNSAVERGAFRADLLYRIRVARIVLPPLRDRRGDIPLLIREFLNQCCAAIGKPAGEVSSDAMRLLIGYPWPGNVRELKSALEFAVIRSRGPVLKADDLPPEIVGSSERRDLGEAGPSNGENRIIDALRRSSGNRSRAARLLGISRATLYRRLGTLGIETKP